MLIVGKHVTETFIDSYSSGEIINNMIFTLSPILCIGKVL